MILISREKLNAKLLCNHCSNTIDNSKDSNIPSFKANTNNTHTPMTLETLKLYIDAKTLLKE